jgi:AcrR family transcriptional regulator
VLSLININLEEQMTKRQDQAKETRQRIYDTAMSLIGTKGFNNVTVEDICKKAGVSTGSFYNYFRSKQHIIIEHTAKIDEYYQEIFSNTLINLKGLKKLEKFLELALGYIDLNIGRHLSIVLYADALNQDYTNQSVLIDENRFLFSCLESMLHEACEEGELPVNIDIGLVVEHIGILLRGSIYNWCLYGAKHYDLTKTTLCIIMSYIAGIKTKMNEIEKKC